MMQSLLSFLLVSFIFSNRIYAFTNTDIPLEQWRHWAANKEQVKKEYMEWKKSEAGKHAMENELWGDSKHPSDPEATLKERVRRFYLSKLRIKELERQNPDAQFSTDTPFAIMNPQEFEEFVGQSFGEMKHDFEEADKARRFRRHLLEEAAHDTLPSKDWTTSGCVSPVKTQGACGACYAFASVEALESAYCIKNKVLPSLSVEQVVGCSGQKCVGGTREQSFEYIQKQGGLCRADASPDWTVTAKPKCVEKCDRLNIPIKNIEYVERTDSALLKAIDRQPVTVNVATGDVWMYYKGGIVTSCATTKVAHSVLAVGYGSDVGQHYLDQNQRYIKLKNSWGPGWGENGYIRLRLGTGPKGTCSYLMYNVMLPVL